MSDLDFNTLEKHLEQLKNSPSTFIEEVCGIKLNTYQKKIIEELSKCKPTPRRPMRKYHHYIDLCIAYSRMKDDDNIVIVSPKKWEKLNKERFAEYIENYWK